MEADARDAEEEATKTRAEAKAAREFAREEARLIKEEAERRAAEAEAELTRREKARLLPIRTRSRGERRSLRTFPVVTLHPRFPFNV